MYKMVRKGNTSLQYTIIPQTDQLSSSTFPQSRKYRSGAIKYTIPIATLMILIIVSYITTPLLISQHDQNLFTSSVLAIGRKSQIRNATRSQIKEANVDKSKNETSIEVKTKQQLKDEVITPPGNLKGDEGKVSDSITTDPTTSTEQQLLQTTPELLKTTLGTFRTTVWQKSSTPTSTMETSTSSTSPTSELPTRGSDKSAKVPLKLMENETMTEQYEEAEVSDYKNGNASVLGSGVSLEELIFKTSGGTMQPRSEKRFFRNFPWQMQKYDVFMPVAGFACFVSAGVMMFLYLRRWCAMLRQNVEEPEIEGHEEDKSTLLESLTETEDIE